MQKWHIVPLFFGIIVAAALISGCTGTSSGPQPIATTDTPAVIATVATPAPAVPTAAAVTRATTVSTTAIRTTRTARTNWVVETYTVIETGTATATGPLAAPVTFSGQGGYELQYFTAQAPGNIKVKGGALYNIRTPACEIDTSRPPVVLAGNSIKDTELLKNRDSIYLPAAGSYSIAVNMCTDWKITVENA